MDFASYSFVIGIILFVLIIIQLKLHAHGGFFGQTWDSEVQENLCYTVLCPMSLAFILASPAFLLLEV